MKSFKEFISESSDVKIQMGIAGAKIQGVKIDDAEDLEFDINMATSEEPALEKFEDPRVSVVVKSNYVEVRYSLDTWKILKKASSKKLKEVQAAYEKIIRAELENYKDPNVKIDRFAGTTIMQ